LSSDHRRLKIGLDLRFSHTLGFMTTLEKCPGCQALLPRIENGVIHRYMTSSAACWEIFGKLFNDPDRPVASSPFNALSVDAYAVHHPGTPSNQTINSVAIHTMVLYGILERGFKPDQALWLRQRPGRANPSEKHGRFHWLPPPSFEGSLTVADVVAGGTPLERSALLERWVRELWSRWGSLHEGQIGIWFERFVIAEKI
jgi:hypothetical protein